MDSLLPPEYDDYKRDVEIKLYWRLLEGQDKHDEDSLRRRGKELCHWMLVFEFCDNSYRVIEGINEDGKLVPSFTKNREDGWVEDKNFGKRKMSPLEVRKLALKNSLNGKDYSLLMANCQSWINETLKDLGEETFVSTIGDELTWKGAAIVLGTVVNPFVGLGIVLGHEGFKLTRRLFD